MHYVLIGRLKNYRYEPPEERTWDFGDDEQTARETHQVWSAWMADGLWQFRDWGWPGEITCIKPGAFFELDLRVINDWR